MNSYKKAPTWLTNLEGESQLFETQEKVDDAWDEGWFGPPWLVSQTPLISGSMDKLTKREIRVLVSDDPRYDGLEINIKNSLSEIHDILREFEISSGIGEIVGDA